MAVIMTGFFVMPYLVWHEQNSVDGRIIYQNGPSSSLSLLFCSLNDTSKLNKDCSDSWAMRNSHLLTINISIRIVKPYQGQFTWLVFFFRYDGAERDNSILIIWISKSIEMLTSKDYRASVEVNISRIFEIQILRHMQ